MKLQLGKIPPDILESLVFSRIGVADGKVLVGPRIGEDAAIIDIGGGKVLAIHIDPITEAVERIGWLSIHIASNDIAVRGVKPTWFLSVILLPSTSTVEALDMITKQMDSALREVGGTIIGGHTEVAPGVKRPIVVVTSLGVGSIDELTLTEGARPGDYVIMTKAVGLEGTAIIASDFVEELLSLGVQQSMLDEAVSYFKDISVVKEALALAKIKVPSSMHDPTEGGLLNGLLEVALASRCVIEVYEDRIPIRTPTKTICEVLGIDPLKLISSGTLIATIKPESLDTALDFLNRMGVRPSVIGKVVEGEEPKVLLHRVDGRVEEVSSYVKDEITKLWANVEDY
ncbi:MAG: AIR synthase family protein [Candidatus Nezhaarchaeales archaeon]